MEQKRRTEGPVEVAISTPASPDETRRRFVGGLAGAALLVACGDGDTTNASSEGTTGSGGGQGGSAAGPGSGGSGASGGVGATGGGGQGGTGGTPPGECTVYPQQTAGPFYLDLDMVRSDITEGKPGAHMELRIDVVMAGSCEPVEGAAIDVWQNDSQGVYSGFKGQLGGLDTTGQTFLRGTQITDAAGRVTFTTIYPGWYPGRTTHIHFRVHPTSTSQATSQL